MCSGTTLLSPGVHHVPCLRMDEDARRPRRRTRGAKLASRVRSVVARPAAIPEERSPASAGGLIVFAVVLLVGSLASSALAVRLHNASHVPVVPTFTPAGRAIIFMVDGLT